MIKLDSLSDNSDQLLQSVLDDGTIVTLEFLYKPAVQRWFFNVTYGTTIINGLGLCVHPNLLRQWRNTLPFGICCITTDGVDPINTDDFVNARAAVYVLNSTDVEFVESSIIPA
jgi:hypothetical protein